MLKKPIGFIFSFMLIILIVSGCGAKPTVEDRSIEVSGGTEDQEIEGSQQESDTNNLEEDLSDDADSPLVTGIYAPLTGLPVVEEINDRIIGVLINNHNKARPQSGLNQADIIYEVLAEARITRFIAFYQSNKPEVIGPIRSIRPYYLDIINGFDALIVHSGGSDEAYATIFSDNSLPDLDEIRRAQEAYWRVNFREMPHNLYTSTEKIIAAADKRGFLKKSYIPKFIFLKESQPVNGEILNEVEIAYSPDYRVAFQYDSTTKLYQRLINGLPHVDLETNEQLTAKNILVIEAKHQIIDSVGRRKIDVYGPGSGKLIQNGEAKDITWQRVDGVIRAFIDGEEQGLYPGQTWIIVVDSNTKLTYK